MSDLATLYARDPLSYSKQDLDIIILKLREARANFKLDEATPKATKPAAAKKVHAGPSIDLSSLGLVKK